MIKDIKYNRLVNQFNLFLDSCTLNNTNCGLVYTLIKHINYLYYYNGDDTDELTIYYNDCINSLCEFGLEHVTYLDKNTICQLLIEHYVKNTIYDTSELKIYCLTGDIYQIIIRETYKNNKLDIIIC